MRIHALQVDFSCQRIVARVIITRDPDGDGPANAELTLPQQMIENLPVLAFINTNPGMPCPTLKASETAIGTRASTWRYSAWQPPKVCSAAVCPGTYSIWWDRQGKIHFGEETPAAEVQEGIAGFCRCCAGPIVPIPPTNVLNRGRLLAPRTTGPSFGWWW